MRTAFTIASSIAICHSINTALHSIQTHKQSESPKPLFELYDYDSDTDVFVERDCNNCEPAGKVIVHYGKSYRGEEYRCEEKYCQSLACHQNNWAWFNVTTDAVASCGYDWQANPTIIESEYITSNFVGTL